MSKILKISISYNEIAWLFSSWILFFFFWCRISLADFQFSLFHILTGTQQWVVSVSLPVNFGTKFVYISSSSLFGSVAVGVRLSISKFNILVFWFVLSLFVLFYNFQRFDGCVMYTCVCVCSCVCASLCLCILNEHFLYEKMMK